jgi:hypothetical protein
LVTTGWRSHFTTKSEMVVDAGIRRRIWRSRRGAGLGLLHRLEHRPPGRQHEVAGAWPGFEQAFFKAAAGLQRGGQLLTRWVRINARTDGIRAPGASTPLAMAWR